MKCEAMLSPSANYHELMAPLGVFSAAQLIVAVQVRLRPEFKEMWALIKGLTESGETLHLGPLAWDEQPTVVGWLVGVAYNLVYN